MLFLLPVLAASGLASRQTVLRTAQRLAPAPRMDLDILGADSSVDCLVLPHPPYPGTGPAALRGECNLVVSACRSAATPPLSRTRRTRTRRRRRRPSLPL